LLINEKVSVVVPCYKDEGSIKELIKRLSSTLEQITANWEIIYINDNSPDNSQAILEEIVSNDKRIKLIRFSRNFGVMSVFYAGIEIAQGDIVVLMDGDLQDPPELIVEFVNEWLKGYLVVYGIREKRDESLLRRIGYKLFYPLWNWLTDFEIPEHAGEFALIDRKVVDIILTLDERNMFLRGMRSWVGFPQIGVKYYRPKRYSGESTQSLISYINWASKAITSFSTKPLKIAIVFTLIMTLFLVVLLISKLVIVVTGRGAAPPGFFTLLFTIIIIGITQLFSIAVISEYMMHIFFEVKKRPNFIIRDTINLEKECSICPKKNRSS
jgi:polyisoprenyl-phosphate glycosyltransferase